MLRGEKCWLSAPPDYSCRESLIFMATQNVVSTILWVGEEMEWRDMTQRVTHFSASYQDLIGFY